MKFQLYKMSGRSLYIVINIIIWRSRIVAIAIVSKTITPYGVRGFESHLLRIDKFLSA